MYEREEQQGNRIRTIRIILFGIILATIPFYCIGFGLLFVDWGTSPQAQPTRASATPLGGGDLTAAPTLTPLATLPLNFTPATQNRPLQPTPQQFTPIAPQPIVTNPPVFIPTATNPPPFVPTSTPPPPLPTNTPIPQPTVPPPPTNTPLPLPTDTPLPLPTDTPTPTETPFVSLGAEVTQEGAP